MEQKREEREEMNNDTNLGVGERLLKKKEVAQVLSCCQRSVDRLANSGKLTRVKIMGAVRFRWTQVQGLITGGNHDFQS
ncbi:MAG TPA: helix-turn-helix domain-containing protein [Candidatus Acidoferrum sp.]|nr:helix-turn-helix domain-containing protein [Candidatus Acidoferrum sp.]